MGKGTSIEWCDHSFNPWWGCSKVSPACRSCYAEAFAKRVGERVWGETAGRRFFGDAHWAEPERWNRDAERAGTRRRVFCASMADVFENRPDLEAHRARLWKLIERTPWLDWLLLTKRPENHEMVPLAWQTGSRRPANVWLGCTCEDNEWAAKRIPHLLCATWPAVRFVSAEPLLERLQILPYLGGQSGVTWVITGYESGARPRPTDEDWVRSLRDQCWSAGVAFFYKQKLVGRLKVGTPEIDGRRWAEFPRLEVTP